MKIARITCFALLALVVVIAVLPNLLAPGLDRTPPDPATLIVMPDGDQTTLGDLLERIQLEDARDATASDDEDREPAPPVNEAATEAVITPPAAEPTLVTLDREQIERLLERHRTRPPPEDDVFALAEYSRHQGLWDQAHALYRSVPPGDGDYARAQRRLGWDVFARGYDDPGGGVAHVNASLRADPLDGNGWQDASRVYLRTLGIPAN